MSPFPEFLIAILIFGTLVAAILWAIVSSGKKGSANLQAVADRLGLQLSQKRTFNLVTEIGLAGVVQGRPVRFWHYTTGSGKSRKSWSAVGVRTRGTPALTFRLSRQGFGTKVLEVFGAKEIQVGDPAFDTAWFVQTNRPEFFGAALVPQIREKLMAADLGKRGGHFRCESGEVIYAEMGGFADTALTQRLERQLPVLQDLADVVEVAG